MENELLTATVHGIGILPELSRHYTSKHKGNHITFRLRRREDRVTLCYLPTQLYVGEDMFDPGTKQVLHGETNQRLIKLFGRAVAMVRDAPVGSDYKELWEREQMNLVAEARQEKKARILDFFENLNKEERYAALIAQREELDRELLELDAKIEALRLELKLPLPAATVTRNDMVEFKDTMTKFLNVRKNTLGERDFQMWTSWHKVLTDCAATLGFNLSIATIDLGFYKKYKHYIMVTRGNTANTFGAHVKRLKSFLKYAEGEGKVLHREAKNINFKIVEEKKKVVYLNDEELNVLWDYRLVRPSAMRIIHLALFQSLTGLRISDVAKAHTIVKRKDDATGELREYLSGNCKKTGGAYLIPLSLDPRIKEILFENSCNMKLLTEQVFNRDIKNILRDMYAHFRMPNEIIQIERQNVKGEMTNEEVLKSNLISTHSNRRSFISRHINSKEFNHSDILKMLGSTDLKELQKYIDIDDQALNEKAKASARTRTLKAQKAMKV